MTDRDAERFWMKVRKKDGCGCWLWIAGKGTNGYGQFSWVNDTGDYVNRRAHRCSWELQNGTIPEGLFVLHHCDNRLCVRPDHLWLGTDADNVRDRDEKGRQARGEQQGLAKLTKENVLEIRALSASGMSGVALARQFGVSGKCVSLIVNGKTWKHVGEA